MSQNEAVDATPHGTGEPKPDLQRVLTVMIRLAGLAFLVAWAFYLARVFWFQGDKLEATQAAMGQMGDFLGGTLNPVLSGLTLLGLVFTVRLQHQQLVISKAELSATRDELKKTTAAQEATADAMGTQAHYATITARLQALAAGVAALESIQEDRFGNAHFHDVDGKEQLMRQKRELADRIIAMVGELDELEGRNH